MYIIVVQVPVRCKLPAFMAEGSSKALDDVTLPAKEKEEEEIVTLDFDDDTLTGELSAAFFSRRGFVIIFRNVLLDLLSLAFFSFSLKLFRVKFLSLKQALRNENSLK